MVNEACRKISRGQVWFLTDNDVPLVHTAGSVIGKNRPWLIVSNNKCNQVSPIYTVVPLTSQPKIDLPTHVTFTVGDKENTILCEQIRTVSQQAFNNPGSYYKFTLSEKIMRLVDEALAVQLDLSLTFPNSDRFWESLERLIRVRVKQAIADTKIEPIDISKVACLMDTKVENIIKGVIDPEPKEEVTEEKIEEKSVENEPARDWVPVKKSKRRTWTDEEKEKFLEYYDKHGAKSTAAFYDLQLGSVYTTRFKFIKELGETK